MWTRLGINHQSPLIHLILATEIDHEAGNQSPIPFDTLLVWLWHLARRWESITNPL